MKGKKLNLSTHVFNFRLFLEGLKRLRVIGLATAILALTVSALIPTVAWIENGHPMTLGIYEVEEEFLCVPAGAVVCLAPCFFAVLFSFLQKRKESDFFHAIPYTRTCVYVSFVAAALTFVFAIQLACGLVAGILWGIAPGIHADLGAMTAYVFICMLAAAMLSAFMMLALTVSGTGGSCTLLFLLFTAFIRVIAAIFLGCLDSLDILPTSDMWESSFLSPLWLLPINVFYYWGTPQTAVDLMYSFSNILYSFAVTVALFGLAGFIYKHRRSEMAGNPAPGKTTQALFRIMFTTLPALLIPLLILVEGGDAALLVLVVCVLLVYFLYELITTKRPKNLLKIIPGLGIVAGVCVTFIILFYAYRGLVLYEDITVDEVKSVSVESNGFDDSSYQGHLASEMGTDDPEIIRTAVRQLVYSQKSEREFNSDTVSTNYWNRTTVTFRLKGGRTISRDIIFDEKTIMEVQERYMTLDEIRDLKFLIPADREVSYGGYEIGNRYYTDFMHTDSNEELYALLATFRREFEALTDAEKLEVMAPAFRSYSYEGERSDENVTLTLRGRMDGIGEYYFSRYIITEAMPDTRSHLVGLWGVGQKEACYYDRGGQTFGGSVDDVLIALGEDAGDPSFATSFPLLKGSITLVGMGEGNAEDYLDQTLYLESQDYTRFAELLLTASTVHANTEIGDVAVTDTTYMLVLHTNMDDKYSQLNLSLYGLFDMSPEVYEELKELLQIYE